MEVLRDPASLASLPGPVFLAIGIFDGVHRGHQALIAEAQADAARMGGTAAVMTFEPHPMMYFQHAEPPLRLSGPRHKELLLAGLGVTHAAVMPFGAVRAAQAPEEFVAGLVASCRPLGGICVGDAWRFGRGRAGDIALLKELGRRGGFEVDGIPAVRLHGEVISSTAIRLAVSRGDLGYAAAALGRPYGVLGPVVPGRKLGRRMGYPTANIVTDGLQLPPDGVYVARVALEGCAHRAMVNLGCRPTVGGETARVLEAHVLGFDGDLYGRELEVEFLRFLRPERKFASLDDLRVQIARDIAEAK